MSPARPVPAAPASAAAVHLLPSLNPSLNPAAAPLCELRNIRVSRGSCIANADVSFCIRPGEIVALLGENGAGKSTALHAIYGLVPVSSGQVLYGDQPVEPTPERAIGSGIGLVSQHFLLIPRLTVAENIVLGREPRRQGGPPGFYDLRRAEEEVAALGARYGLAVDPRRRVAELSVGEAQRVEILKTLYRGARCLLLDEPTAVLTPQEARRLLGVLRQLVSSREQEAAGLLIVTHKLDEVMEVADRAVVLRAGRVVAEYPRALFSAQSMAHALVGRELHPVVRQPASPERSAPSAPVLSVRDLRVTQGGVERVRGVSFELQPGSILGVAGVEGNGQSELCAALVGLLMPTAGQVRLADRDLTRASVRQRCAAGLSFVLEDRQRHGLVLDFSLAENLLLGQQPRYRRGPHPPLRWLIDRPRLVRDAQKLLAEHDVRPPDPSLPARALSGGNQQKLLLARALAGAELPRVLIASQPTRGVDVGAIEAIYRVLLAARDRGCAILLVSTELDELRTLCDRIVVLYRGQLASEMPNPPDAPVTRERLGELMAGVGAPGSPGWEVEAEASRE